MKAPAISSMGSGVTWLCMCNSMCAWPNLFKKEITYALISFQVSLTVSTCVYVHCTVAFYCTQLNECFVHVALFIRKCY